MDTLLPIAMVVLTLGGILMGYRVAFVLAGSAAIFILVSHLPLAFFNLIVSRIYANVLSNWLLVAIPMFIFMGLILERSGVAERALKGAQRALGGTAAGMGLSVLVIGVLLAASSAPRWCCWPCWPCRAFRKPGMTTPRRRGWWPRPAPWRSCCRRR